MVQYRAGDHLGSTAITANSSGVKVGELRYRAYGETRYTSGTTPTSYRYTGQREESGLGLYRMGARWYDPALSRWLSPDTLVPEAGEPQAFNRYSYAGGNPVRYRDPSGHWLESALDIAGIAYDIYDIKKNGLNWENGLSLAADVGGLILPGVTGGGLAVRAIAHADDIADAARLASHVDEVVDVATHADEAVDAARILSHTDDAADATKLTKVDETLSCPGCGQRDPQILRGRGAIATRQHIDPSNLGMDGISAWCSNCNASSGKFWGRSASEIQAFAQQIGLDPGKALVYTPQYGGTGHWSLFIDAIGPDGYLLPQYADLIEEFLRAGIPVKR